MGNRPSEQDRNLSAVVQLASGVAFFGAAWWVARTHRARRSAYLSYWLRVSAIWSVIVVLLLACGIVAVVRLGTGVPIVLTIALHILACVMAALSAATSTCFGYFFVGRFFCREHMERAWPELVEYEEIDSDEPAAPAQRQDRIAPPAAPGRPTSDEVREMYPE